MIQGLFGVDLALFWRGDIWPFGAPWGSLRGTPGVSGDFYRYDRLLIGQCKMVFAYHPWVSVISLIAI